MTAPPGPAPALAERLAVVLGPPLGLDPAHVTIDNLRVLRHTVRRTTWAFDAVTPQGRRALILHAGQPGQDGNTFKIQAQIHLVATEAGVPVARFLAGDDSTELLGRPFLITEMLEGETDPSRIVAQLDRVDPREGRARLLHQCASVLATIHRVKPSTTEQDPRQQRLATFRRKLDESDGNSAIFEWAFRWLTTNQPPPAPPVLIHGDFMMANLVVNGTNLTGVLDWEWVRVGEANDDLAWFCTRPWRFGAPARLGAGGLGSIQSLLRAYQETSGTTVDLAGFHWWRVMGALFWGLTLRDQAEQWLAKQVPTMQLATTGHGVCEAEWDLLDLLDGKPIDDLTEPAGPAAHSGTSSPGWKDLLA